MEGNDLELINNPSGVSKIINSMNEEPIEFRIIEN